MHIYPYMDFETLKRHLLKGNVIITFESMTSDKVFTKTCTLKDIKIKQKGISLSEKKKHHLSRKKKRRTHGLVFSLLSQIQSKKH